MISPNTPPGTEIVCVDDAPNKKYWPKGYTATSFDMSGLKRGCVYTVKNIDQLLGTYQVHLAEISREYALTSKGQIVGYHLARFRLISRFANDSEYTVSAPVDEKERANV